MTSTLRNYALLVLVLMSGWCKAGEYRLVIENQPVNVTGQERTATTINGMLPGPVLHWREGEEVVIHVTNRHSETTSLHWHGLVLPENMDGVTGPSFSGIAPGATFTYRFPIRQSGTYWYHSHSSVQQQAGMYAPIIIDPAVPEQRHSDRDYVVMLSDWTDEDPKTVYANLKKQNGYYNFQKRTVFDFFRDVAARGLGATVEDRLDWGQMRMDPTDIADVTGATYTYLLNGASPGNHWTGIFKPGEQVRLRFINASAMTHFDVSIPGLKLTVVQTDGRDVQPVTVDEFRIAPAETYDVVVEPKEERVFTLFAETMDRSGYARGALAPRPGMAAAEFHARPRPLLTMADMGHAAGGMPADDHSGHSSAAPENTTQADPHAHLHHGPAPQSAGINRLREPGIGLTNTDAHRVLVYGDLRSRARYADRQPARREIELRLVGNMQRFIWAIEDKTTPASAPIVLHYGERVRFTLVNETMMNHPIHLHGLWSDLDTGAGQFNPRKHVINVKPNERLSFDVTADALGAWPLHCHLLYHMEAGMHRTVIVENETPPAAPASDDIPVRHVH